MEARHLVEWKSNDNGGGISVEEGNASPGLDGGSSACLLDLRRLEELHYIELCTGQAKGITGILNHSLSVHSLTMAGASWLFEFQFSCCCRKACGGVDTAIGEAHTTVDVAHVES